MRTAFGPLFVPSNSYRIVRSTPNYDPSTDGYRGQNYKVVALCGTMESAVNALDRCWAEQDELDESEINYEVGYFLVHPSGYDFPAHQWDTVNSHYIGPIFDPWDHVPF